MADASIHIHIDNPVPMSEIDKLITAAIEAKGTMIERVIPTGYRCAICFRQDGGHDATCTVNKPAGVR